MNSTAHYRLLWPLILSLTASTPLQQYSRWLSHMCHLDETGRERNLFNLRHTSCSRILLRNTLCGSQVDKTIARSLSSLSLSRSFSSSLFLFHSGTSATDCATLHTLLHATNAIALVILDRVTYTVSLSHTLPRQLYLVSSWWWWRLPIHSIELAQNDHPVTISFFFFFFFILSNALTLTLHQVIFTHYVYRISLSFSMKRENRPFHFDFI